MGLARPLTCLLSVGSMVLTVTCVYAVVRSADRGPLYSVATVQAGLAHQPDAWVGRTVRIRGIAALCLSSDHPQSCSQGPMYLMDAVRSEAVLPLAWGSQDAVHALLRRVPLVHAVVAPPQTPRWWLPATYWVQLRATGLCGVSPCYETVLLDATP